MTDFYYTKIKTFVWAKSAKKSEKNSTTVKKIALDKILSGRTDTKRKIWIWRSFASFIFKM